MLYEGVKLNFYLQKRRCILLKTAAKERGMLRTATKDLVKMLQKRFGHPNQELDSVNSFKN